MREFTKEQIKSERSRLEANKIKKINMTKISMTKLMAYSILIFYTLISLWPFLWSFFASLKNPNLLSTTGANPFPRSNQWTLVNYKNLFGGVAGEHLWEWTNNTVVYCTFSALLNATLNLLAGYALAQISMKGKKIVMSYFMISILIPSQATFVPTYYMYTKLGIISYEISTNIFLLAIIFSGMANIILTFMARQFFLTQTPEMEQAAAMEGYSKLSIFFKITLRKMLPLFATQFVLVFMGAWNNFITFTLFAGGFPEKMTLNAGIVSLGITQTNKQLGYGIMLAMSNLTFIPMIIIYYISLKIQMRGIKSGNK